MSNSNHTVIIRNLTKSSGISDSELTDSIYDLLNTYMEIATIRNCIKIKTENNKRSALIRLKSLPEVFNALDRLKDGNSRNSLGFKFQRIADTGEAIEVQMELPERFYQKDHNIGKETRKYEFKLGGGEYVKNFLKEDVSRYICGFLNGRTKGTLFIGVDDHGYVKGTNCKNEDKIRRDYIDEGIRAIKPPVDNKDLQVEFVPVVENDQIKANLNVIKITVFKKKKLKKLLIVMVMYMYDEKVVYVNFLRLKHRIGYYRTTQRLAFCNNVRITVKSNFEYSCYHQYMLLS